MPWSRLARGPELHIFAVAIFGGVRIQEKASP